MTVQFYSANSLQPQVYVSRVSVPLRSSVSPGTPVTSVQAITFRQGALFVYHIAAGNVGYVFDMTPAGQVFVRVPMLYNTPLSYTLWLQAVDISQSPPVSGTVSVTILITPDNLYVPWFPQPVYYVTVLPVPTSQSLLTLGVIDLNVNASSRIVYTLVTPGLPFAVDQKSGLLSLTTRNLPTSPLVYQLTVQATDQVNISTNHRQT